MTRQPADQRARREHDRQAWPIAGDPVEIGDQERQQRLVQQGEEPHDHRHQQHPAIGDEGQQIERWRSVVWPLMRRGEALRRQPEAVDQHQAAAGQEDAPPSEPKSRRQGQGEWRQQIPQGRPGVHPADHPGQVIARQVHQRHLAAMDEGVAGRAPDEGGGEQHDERVR